MVLRSDEPRRPVAEAARLAGELPLAAIVVIYLGTRIRSGPRRRTLTSEGLERTLATGCLTRLAVLDRIHERLREDSPRPRIVLRARAGRGFFGAVAGFDQKYSSYLPERACRNAVVGNEAPVRGAAERYPGLAVSALASQCGRLSADPPSQGLFDSRGRPVPASYGFDARWAGALLRVSEKMVQPVVAESGAP
jgi:hypothetical protein